MFARLTSSSVKSPAIKTSWYALRWFCSKIRRHKETGLWAYAYEGLDHYDAAK